MGPSILGNETCANVSRTLILIQYPYPNNKVLFKFFQNSETAPKYNLQDDNF